MPTPSLPPSIDESARRRFEEAWRAGHPGSIDGFLPPVDDPCRLATLEELILIELEFAWKAFGERPTGPFPRVEDYLARFPELSQPNILRLAQQECRVRRRNGDSPPAAEYAARFPELEFAGAYLDTASAPDRSDPTGPPTLDGYEVLGRVGEGGMGLVYEAREERLGRVVAVKVPRRGEAADPAKRQRFVTEARIAAALEHPGIVPVHELVAEPGADPFYAMKLVRGRTLDATIRDYHAGKGSERAVGRQRLLTAFLAVAETMAFAHSRGVIHRDLKPANVILGDYGETVILDWGLAKVVRCHIPSGVSPTPTELNSAPQDLTIRGDVMGTPAFMAPEQAAGRTEEVDELSDVYALGVILYQILTGRLPHSGSSATEVLQLVQDADPPPPRAVNSDIPRALEAICLRAMARQREARYPGAGELAADVERYLAGEPVSAYREVVSERMGRWARRNRTLVAVGVVAAILGTIGTAAGLYLQEKAADERQAQERQQELERVQARYQRRADLERAAAENEGLAKAAFHAGRFADAEVVLRGAVAKVRNVEGLTALATRLEDQRRWARKLDEFYQFKDRAELSAFETDPQGSRTDPLVILAAEAGLARLGLLDAPAEWWVGLSADAAKHDLSELQQARLNEDACAVMVTLALWRIKRGLNPVLVAQAEAARTGDLSARAKVAVAALSAVPEFEGAQALARRVLAYRATGGVAPVEAARVVDTFCTALLEPATKLPRRNTDAKIAADAVFLGCAHLLLSVSVQEGTDPAQWTAAMKGGFGDTFDRMGLDLATPKATADRLFRKALALDPNHYIARAQLAICHMLDGDWAGAEQQWNTCVGLRPGSVLAYQYRCDAIFKQFDAAARAPARPMNLATAAVLGPLGALSGSDPGGRARGEILRRCLDGLNQAPAEVRADPVIRWYRSMCHVGLLEWPRVLESAAGSADGLAALVVADAPATATAALTTERLEVWLSSWVAGDPRNADVRAVLAATLLARGKTADAGREADAVLAQGPHWQALAVRGVVHLRAGRPTAAREDFGRSLALAGGSELAAVGLALALEQAEEWTAARVAYGSLPRPAALPGGPLHLVALLGQARVSARLGENDTSRTALEAARLIDPVAADALAAKLVPAAKK